MNRKTGVAVIGAGHAGIEAALASARMGIDTVLFTTNLDAVGNMPCNPSIGGSAKGHLVFEIDALGGEMGYAADLATIQSRTLNLGKGAAVHSKRVQADRAEYKRVMKMTLENEKNLRLIQSEIVDIITEEIDGKPCVRGVLTGLGEIWECNRAIIATGTFLESEIFVGDKVFSAGPDGLMPAKGLSESLRRLGLTLQRFKTGTPARVHRRSVELSGLEIQEGESEPIPYSVRTEKRRWIELISLPAISSIPTKTPTRSFFQILKEVLCIREILQERDQDTALLLKQSLFALPTRKDISFSLSHAVLIPRSFIFRDSPPRCLPMFSMKCFAVFRDLKMPRSCDMPML